MNRYFLSIIAACNLISGMCVASPQAVAPISISTPTPIKESPLVSDPIVEVAPDLKASIALRPCGGAWDNPGPKYYLGETVCYSLITSNVGHVAVTSPFAINSFSVHPYVIKSGDASLLIQNQVKRTASKIATMTYRNDLSFTCKAPGGPSLLYGISDSTFIVTNDSNRTNNQVFIPFECLNTPHPINLSVTVENEKDGLTTEGNIFPVGETPVIVITVENPAAWATGCCQLLSWAYTDYILGKRVNNEKLSSLKGQSSYEKRIANPCINAGSYPVDVELSPTTSGDPILKAHTQITCIESGRKPNLIPEMQLDVYSQASGQYVPAQGSIVSAFNYFAAEITQKNIGDGVAAPSMSGVVVQSAFSERPYRFKIGFPRLNPSEKSPPLIGARTKCGALPETLSMTVTANYDNKVVESDTSDNVISLLNIQCEGVASTDYPDLDVKFLTQLSDGSFFTGDILKLKLGETATNLISITNVGTKKAEAGNMWATLNSASEGSGYNHEVPALEPGESYTRNPVNGKFISCSRAGEWADHSLGANGKAYEHQLTFSNDTDNFRVECVN